MRVLKVAQKRKAKDVKELQRTVADIIENVIENGDKAMAAYSLRFDGCTRESLRVSASEIQEAYAQVSDSEIEDIQRAAANIRAFAEAQRATLGELRGFSPVAGVQLGHRIIPVRAAGCYVPGGDTHFIRRR